MDGSSPPEGDPPDEGGERSSSIASAPAVQRAGRRWPPAVASWTRATDRVIKVNTIDIIR
jgi:hypothetical protein